MKIGVIGGLGRMGQEAIEAISNEADMEVTAVLDVYNVGETIKIGDKKYLVESEIKKVSSKVEVFLDLTGPKSVKKNAEIIIGLQKKLIIGATGLSESDIEDLTKKAEEKRTGVMIIPNFAIGAVLMMEFSQKAAKYFNETEIIEYHHPKKLDAPSGTAIKTAKLINEVKAKRGKLEGKELIEGARGAKMGDIDIHSIRLNGYVASQEVIFGAEGQTLKIRHDSINRKSFMPGIILAIQKIGEVRGVIYGLEKVL